MATNLFHRIPVLGMFMVRPRLMVATCVGIVVAVFLPQDWHGIARFLTAWDSGVGLYILLVIAMMWRSDNARIRQNAEAEDEGALISLGLTVFGAVASLAAIVRELAIAKTLSGHAEGQAVALAGLTVLLSWIFMQTMFALHYAHEFYKADRATGDGGLEFPGQFRTPDYWDFVYFSFVIGTAAATADINLTSQIMRRIVTLHCIVVFFFNTSILALAINIGASLAS